MSIAFVFPGQGSQYVGMGRALAEASPAAREALEQADYALGRPLTRLLFEGPEEELRITWNTQPAILAVSVACLRALREAVELRPAALAGHSLGEYSALVAAGALEYGDALRIVEKRGRFMQEAVPLGTGTMAAVLGLDAGPLELICADVSRPGGVVEVANDNCPGQVVISGHKEAAEEAGRRAREAGAKRALPLPVSAPFHCSLMLPAGERLAAVLEEVELCEPDNAVVANVDAQPNREACRIRDLLVRQVSSPVRWQESVRRLAAMGVDTFVEVGPGKVLSGLVRRIVPEARVLNVEDPSSLEALGAQLRAAA
ncbi:MAG: ACP S-malonyltransferase [Deltaproteobacteria bacterium]|nr:ACP S-malonyltransferase [Deltaproteobacteria bacterium]